jgi:hypothetical protein
MKKLIAAFRNFAKTPKNESCNNDETLVAPVDSSVTSNLHSLPK